MASLARRNNRDANFWPGYVDALATLLMVIIFVLMVFIVAQFYLTHALSGRDQALEKLNRQISELSELLALEQQTNSDLRLNISQLTTDLQAASAEKDQFASQVTSLLAQRDALESKLAGYVTVQSQLRQRIADLESEKGDEEERLLAAISERDALLAKLRAVQKDAALAITERDVVSAELQDAKQEIETSKETLKLRVAELEILRRDIETLRTVRSELEGQVALLVATKQSLEADKQSLEADKADLSANLKLTEEERELLRQRQATLLETLGRVRDQSKALESRLADQTDKTLLVQKELDQRDLRLEELFSQYELSQLDLTEEQKISAEAKAQVELLNQQLAAVRQQLANLEAALDAAESLAEAQNVEIVDLGKRLNAALATKVQELSRFRSEFFGRLREVLGKSKDIQIVGDRFVFQSEVLFASGSADIAPDGQKQLARVARTLMDFAKRFPPEINWIMAIEGHTDRVPIFNERFHNNWELSSGRAISVVEFLIEQGIPANRLAATGFGEFQPIDPGSDEIGDRRNRRIEIKLTQR